MKKNSESQVNVSFRISKTLYDEMDSLLATTGKSTASFCSYAVDFYIHHIKGKKMIDVDPLKIDQFAYNLKKGSKK